MTRSDYTREVWPIIDWLKEFKEKKGEGFIYSNLVDEKGNQYVDLVQEGGGMFGLALVGFTYVLEELGFRFLSLAGTSAGAINTLLLASLKEKEEAGSAVTKSEQIIEKLAAVNFLEFVDGGKDAVRFTKAVSSKSPSSAKLGLSLLENFKEIKKDFGVNPGLKFKQWLDEIVPVNNTRALLNNVKNHPPLIEVDRKFGEEKNITDPKITLAIIAADITTQSKVVFPEMAGLYYQDPESVNPVDYVRASMAVPFFYTPHIISLKELLADGDEELIRKKWNRKLGYAGPIPPQVMLVDGGIMSNFPIDTLYSPDRILQRPIIGVKLGVDRDRAFESKTWPQFMSNCLDGARNIRDFEFLFGNPIFEDLISYVDMGEHNWLNFQLSDKEKLDLFKRGAKAARDFIERFDWLAYQKKVRINQLNDAKKMNSGLLHVNDIRYKLGFEDKPAYEKIIEEFLKNEPKEILWIDDDFTNDSLELIVLERMNINVSLVSSTYEARKILEKRTVAGRAPAFDLIITDSNRNGNPEEGIQYCEKLCEDPCYQSIPVLIHSKSQVEKLKTARDGFPPNIKNSPGRNVMRLNDLIEEVVEVLARKEKNGQALTTETGMVTGGGN